MGEIVFFWHSLGGNPGQVLQDIVNRYNSKEDNEFHVNLNFINSGGYEAATDVALAKPRDDRPNLVLAPEFMTGKLRLIASTGTDFIPMNEILDEEYLSTIAEIVKKTFGDYALPMNPACGVLYMNRDVLNQLGKAPDWVPTTFEELIKVSQDLMKEKLVDYGFTCAWPESYLVETPLAQQNRPLFVEGEEGSGYNLSQMEDHFFELWKLRQSKVFLPPNLGNYDPAKIPFTQGKVAFFMQGSGHYTILSQETKEKFTLECSALPTLSSNQDVKYAFPLGGGAIWAFNPEEDLPEKAYAPDVSKTQQMIKGVRSFLNYLTSFEIQKEWHEKTAYVLPSLSVIERLKEEGFYDTHSLQKAVIDQTIYAPLGEHSFGIKASNYNKVRSNIYPLIHSLLALEGSEEEVRALIKERLAAFDANPFIRE